MKRWGFIALGIRALIIILMAHVIFLVDPPKEGAQITSLLDAYCWTVTTATTVGYGDVLPVSDNGKILGN